MQAARRRDMDERVYELFGTFHQGHAHLPLGRSVEN